MEHLRHPVSSITRSYTYISTTFLIYMTASENFATALTPPISNPSSKSPTFGMQSERKSIGRRWAALSKTTFPKSKKTNLKDTFKLIEICTWYDWVKLSWLMSFGVFVTACVGLLQGWLDVGCLTPAREGYQRRYQDIVSAIPPLRHVYIFSDPRVSFPTSLISLMYVRRLYAGDADYILN